MAPLILASLLRVCGFAEILGPSEPGTTDYPAGGMSLDSNLTFFSPEPLAGSGGIRGHIDAANSEVIIGVGGSQLTRFHRLSLADLSLLGTHDIQELYGAASHSIFDPALRRLWYRDGNSSLVALDLPGWSQSTTVPTPGQFTPWHTIVDPGLRRALFQTPYGYHHTLDLDSGVIGSVPAPHGQFPAAGLPESIDAAAHMAYVTAYDAAQFENEFLKLDMATGQVVASKSYYAGGPLAHLSVATPVVCDAPRGVGYYGRANPPRLVKFSLADLEDAGELPLTGDADHIVDLCVSSSGLEVFASLWDGRLARFSTSPLALVETLTPGDAVGEEVSILPDGRVLGVSLTDKARVHIYSTAGALAVQHEVVLADSASAFPFVDWDSAAERYIVAGDATPGGVHAYAPGVAMPNSFTHTSGVLPVGFGRVSTGVVDAANRRAYLGTATSPGRVVAIDLDTLRMVDSIELNVGEDTLFCSAIDPAGGRAYFGTLTSPGRVVQVSLSPLARVGATQLAPGEDLPRSLLFDAAGVRVLAGLFTVPARVVALDAASLARLGTIDFPAGEQEITCGAIDAGRGRAVFGTGTDPARALVVDLATLTRAGAVQFDSQSRFLNSARIEPGSGNAFMLTSNAPVRVLKVALDPPRLLGSIEVGLDQPNSMTVGPLGEAYVVGRGVVWDANSFAGVRLHTSHRGLLHRQLGHLSVEARAEELRFYSHAPGGHLWFAIYKGFGNPVPIWTAGPVQNIGGEISVPVADAARAPLLLSPDYYWLAWATDSFGPVAGYVESYGDAQFAELPGFDYAGPLNPPVTGFTGMSGAFAIRLSFTPRSAAEGWSLYD